MASHEENHGGIDVERSDNDLFVGFDARPAPSGSRAQWPMSRRREALLRLDVTVPISVDYLVWPSPWPIESDFPPWRGPVQKLWDDLDRLKDYLRGAPGRWWIVAVALKWNSVPVADRLKWQSRVGGISTTTQWQRWKSLGYDVADNYLTSSLVWYRGNEPISETRAQWGPQLNKRHLFKAFGSAMAFRDHCTASAPEHAPHLVYQLYLGSRCEIGSDVGSYPKT
jgi:hypothetical protein